MLEFLNTPPTLEQALPLIMFIFVTGFAPIWVIWSKRFLDRNPLLDTLNSVITSILVTLFTLSPLLQFFEFEAISPLLIFIALAVLIVLYFSEPKPAVNNLLQDDFGVEFPDYEFEEVTQ